MTKRIDLPLLLISLCLTVTLTTGTALATQIAYEGFDYPTAFFLNGTNGGTGFGGPWSAGPGAIIVAPILSNPLGLPSTGLAVSATFNSYASRKLSASLSQSEYWVSVQLQSQSGAPNEEWLGFDEGPSMAPLIYFGLAGNKFFLDSGVNQIALCCVATPGITDIMIARFTQVGSVTNVDVWVDHDPLTSPIDMSATIPTPAVPFMVLNMDLMPLLVADEVRIGTTPGDVAFLAAGVPEPGTILLLGSGIFGVAGVLRRKLRP